MAHMVTMEMLKFCVCVVSKEQRVGLGPKSRGGSRELLLPPPRRRGRRGSTGPRRSARGSLGAAREPPMAGE